MIDLETLPLDKYKYMVVGDSNNLEMNNSEVIDYCKTEPEASPYNNIIGSMPIFGIGAAPDSNGKRVLAGLRRKQPHRGGNINTGNEPYNNY